MRSAVAVLIDLEMPINPPVLQDAPVASANGRFGLRDWAARAATLVALVGVALILTLHGGVYYSQWTPDVFIPLEGVLHLQHGQWPHRDFATPVGSLWYVINALPAVIMPVSAEVVVWANLIVALVASAAVITTCHGKLPRWLVCLSGFYVGLVALSPRQIGESFQHISNNASYNRYCWSLICAIALASLLPARAPSDRRREAIDGIVAGLLIALCFYIKITYAAAGIGFVVLALMTTRGLSGWRFALVAGLVSAAVVLVAGVVTGDLPGYFADMKTAVAVLPDTARSRQIVYQLFYTVPGLVLVGILSLFAGAPPGRMRAAFGPGLWAGLLTVCAGLAIEVQNHPEPENPLLPIALLVGWTASRLHARGPLRYSARLGDMILGGFVLIMMAGDLCAVGWTAVVPVSASPQVAWLRTTQITDLRIATHDTGPPSPIPHMLQSDDHILGLWDEAIGLLRPHIHGRHDAIVLPFIWSNPFPALLGLPPVRHEVAWWDPERTYNLALKPAPHVLLDPVDFVLVSHGYVNPLTGNTMWAAYGDELHADFRIVGQTPHWDLWARQDCARRGLC